MVPSQRTWPTQEEPFEPCRLCIARPETLKRHPGFYLEDGFAKECKCHSEWKENQVVLRAVKRAGLRTQDINYNPIKDYKGTVSTLEVSKLIHFAHNFKDMKDLSVYLWGPPGSQKTTLINWLGITLIKQGFSVQYVLMHNLLKGIQDNFEDKRKVELAVQSYLQADCLIVDESFDMYKMAYYKSGFQLPFLDNLFRDRMESLMKSTVYVSNVAPESLEKNFNNSFYSLIKRNTVLKGTSLHLRDIYEAEMNRFDVSDMFKAVK